MSFGALPILVCSLDCKRCDVVVEMIFEHVLDVVQVVLEYDCQQFVCVFSTCEDDFSVLVLSQRTV